jgi:hypothetical protein
MAAEEVRQGEGVLEEVAEVDLILEAGVPWEDE